jgi:alpha-tubulin suppressor-like RCC1 family protein
MGTSFTLFLTDNNEIYGCGTNEYGQLGFGEDY